MAGKIARLFQRLKELQGSPPALARGTAVGGFIGFAPVMSPANRARAASS